jgi:hypothetical protein
MRVEVVGRVTIDEDLVAAEFDPDLSAIARFGVRELANHARASAKEQVAGPVSRYIRT